MSQENTVEKKNGYRIILRVMMEVDGVVTIDNSIVMLQHRCGGNRCCSAVEIGDRDTRSCKSSNGSKAAAAKAAVETAFCAAA